MIELKNVFIHDDIAYHIIGIDKLQYLISCDKNEVIKCFNNSISNKPIYEIDGIVTHEGYVVISYLARHNKRVFLHKLSNEEFVNYYNEAIQELRQKILSTDEVLELIEKGEIEYNKRKYYFKDELLMF